MLIVLSVVGLVGGGLFLASRYAFKQVFLAPRKSTESALDEVERRKIFTREDYQKLELEPKEVLSDDGHKLSGQYLRLHPENKKVIILIHGYTGNHVISLQYVEMYRAMGFNILLIDARSHGDSEGVYPTYGIRECEDLSAWIQELRQHGYESGTIGIHGQSMGAATALMYAGKYEDISFVIADCPFSNAKEILTYQFNQVVKGTGRMGYRLIKRLADMKCKVNLEEASPIDAIKDIEVPILFIHGKADTLIPYTMSELMYQSRNRDYDRLVLIEGANHVESHSQDPKIYRTAIQEFIQSVEDLRGY